jgi:hypothetical protein
MTRSRAALNDDSAVAATDSAEQFINVKEAAALLRMAEISIRRFLTKKKLTRYKAAGRTLLRRDQVLGLIKEVR